jgi:methionine synthase II (cobalamin-independent)
MQRSTERILTTHTGSLPRPEDLPTDISQRSTSQLATAVRSVVQSQIDAGVDVVNDGEASKRGYANYVAERLSGFGGTSEPVWPKDLDDFPQFGAQMKVGRAVVRRSSTVHPEVAWAKLAAMAEGARLASRALWA